MTPPGSTHHWNRSCPRATSSERTASSAAGMSMSGTGCADAASLVTSRRTPAADMFTFTDPQSNLNGQYVTRASKYSDPGPLPAGILTYTLISYFTADYIVDLAIILR